jgi:copper chaperone CopZ
MRGSLILALTLAVLAVLVGATTAAAMGKIPGAHTAQDVELKLCELKVDGMTCGGCERAVKKALSRGKGFAKAEVSYKKGNALVHYDPTKTSPQELAELITKETGYQTAVKEAKP